MKESIKVSWVFNLIVSVVVAIVTASVTAYAQSKYSLQNWSVQRTYELKYSVEIMRLDLIKQLSVLIGKTPEINDLWNNYIDSSNIKYSKDRSKIIVKDIALSEKLGNFNGEYQSTLIQAGFLFGPKTKLAIDNFQKEGGAFWTRDTNKAMKIIEAMYSEAQYFDEK